MIAQHHQTAQRRAGHHGFLSRSQKTHVGDMKPVHILGRINGIDHQIFVQMLGQRQLHQDTVDRGIVVQLIDQRQQIGLGRIDIQLVLNRFHADLDRHLAFGADIDLSWPGLRPPAPRPVPA